MCGIVGIFGIRDKNKSSDLVKKMNASIAHRGPDDDGFYVDEQVALGHRRLAIIDLSPAGHQPMHSNDGEIEIIFNGEIYNFLDIKPLLSGYHFKSNSDTEVIIAAYQKWGKKCVDYFNGMFAFAIWDKQKKELFIARDRLGIKPVYYYKTKDHFLFASEVRALLVSGLVSKKINTAALADYFTYQTIHAPQTIIKEVFMLMPGHTMTISEKGVEINKFWSVTENSSSESEGKSYKEVCTDIKELLAASVKRRLIADVPFGAFLSGGIDSSAVVGLMSQVLSNPVKTFTIAFDESEFSEAKYARMISEKFKTEHHEFILKPADFLNEIPLALKAVDHPSGDGPNSYLVSKITRNAGITMALSGLGGDELFAGYPVFNRALKLEQQKWIWNIPSPFRDIFGNLIAMIKPGIASEKMKKLLGGKDGSLQNMFPVARQINTPESAHAFLKMETMPDDAVQGILTNLFLKGDEKIPLLSKVSMAEISSYMQNVLLRDTDQMSMAVALEVRVPFLDYKLVEYVLGVKDEFKQPIFPKKLLVDSLGDLLPDEIVHRKKMGFVFPWAVWLQGELKDFCDEKIKNFAKRDFIREDVLLKRWTDFLKGDKKIRWLDMWLCVVMEHWLEENSIEQ